MKQQEMQKPLVQTALVLLGVILLIGFVAGSDAQGIFSGIGSIVKGVFFSVLFAFALALALVISVIFLFAIFLGAVALYSQDTAKDFYNKLVQAIINLYTTWFPAKAPAPADAEEKDLDASTMAEVPNPETTVKPQVAEQPVSNPESDLIADLRAELSTEISSLSSSVAALGEQNKAFNSSINTLKETVEAAPQDDMTGKIEQLENQQADLTQKLAQCLDKLDTISSAADEGIKLAKQQGNELNTVKSEISSYSSVVAELRQMIESVSVDSTEIHEHHRIFNYLEKDEDKKKFAELIAEAITKELTYAEIDEFLSKSLSKEVDTTIKEHPSLTKQYIRACKNK